MDPDPSTQPHSPPLHVTHLPQPHAWHRRPPIYDPTDPTKVYITHIPPKAHPPIHPTAQLHSLPPPSTTYHTINLIRQVWTGIPQRRGMGWVTAASCGYPQAASAGVHPATASNPYHSTGTKLTGPVIPAMGLLEGIIW